MQDTKIDMENGMPMKNGYIISVEWQNNLFSERKWVRSVCLSISNFFDCFSIQLTLFSVCENWSCLLHTEHVHSEHDVSNIPFESGAHEWRSHTIPICFFFYYSNGERNKEKKTVATVDGYKSRKFYEPCVKCGIKITESRTLSTVEEP